MWRANWKHFVEDLKPIGADVEVSDIAPPVSQETALRIEGEIAPAKRNEKTPRVEL